MSTYPRSTCDFAGQVDGTNLTAVPTGDGGVWRKTTNPSFPGDLVIHQVGGVGYVRRNSASQAIYLADDGPAGYDQRARIRIHVVTANDNSPTVVVNCSDDGNQHYMARWDGNSAKLLHIFTVFSGGVSSQATASYPAGLAAGGDYWIELAVTPGSQVANLYAADGTTVLATCAMSNTQIKRPGLPGIRFGGGTSDTTATGYRIGAFTSEYSPRTVELAPASAVPAPYAKLRIPSVVGTPDYLLCLSEARYTDEGDENPCDVLLWRVGRSAWATVPTLVVLDAIGTVSSGLAQDPSGVYVPATGKTHLFITRYPVGFNSNNAVAGLTGNTATLWLYTSEDQGATWGDPVDVTSQVKNPLWRATIVGPSNGLTVHSSGKIVGTLGYSRADGVAGLGVASIYSEDGETWQRGGQISAEGAGDFESSICELSNGDLICAVRWKNGSATGVQVWRKSSDAGATWTAFDSTTNNPVVPAVSVGLNSSDYGSTSRGLVLHSGPNDASTRVNLSARYSTDRGAAWNDPSLPAASTTRWPAGTRIASAGCGYSSVASDPSGDFFVLYEHPQAGALSLSRIDRTWLGVPEPPPPSVGSPAAIMLNCF